MPASVVMLSIVSSGRKAQRVRNRLVVTMNSFLTSFFLPQNVIVGKLNGKTVYIPA